MKLLGELKDFTNQTFQSNSANAHATVKKNNLFLLHLLLKKFFLYKLALYGFRSYFVPFLFHQMWINPCAQVIFDSDPAPKDISAPAGVEMMSQAMIRCLHSISRVEVCFNINNFA